MGKPERSKALKIKALKIKALKIKAKTSAKRSPAAPPAKTGANKAAVAPKLGHSKNGALRPQAKAGKVAVKKAVTPPAKATTVKKSQPTPKNSAIKMPSKATTTTAKTAMSAQSLPAKAAATVAKKTIMKTVKRKMANVVLPEGYKPSESEPFLGDFQRLYFRKKLLQWKEDIIQQNRETLHVLHEDSNQHADLADRATSETDRALELRARDRQRKLVAKIDQALARIEDGSYGYCEETGEPISLKRLDARPIATLSLEAQERHERRERVYREE